MGSGRGHIWRFPVTALATVLSNITMHKMFLTISLFLFTTLLQEVISNNSIGDLHDDPALDDCNSTTLKEYCDLKLFNETLCTICVVNSRKPFSTSYRNKIIKETHIYETLMNLSSLEKEVESVLKVNEEGDVSANVDFLIVCNFHSKNEREFRDMKCLFQHLYLVLKEYAIAKNNSETTYMVELETDIESKRKVTEMLREFICEIEVAQKTYSQLYNTNFTFGSLFDVGLWKRYYRNEPENLLRLQNRLDNTKYWEMVEEYIVYVCQGTALVVGCLGNSLLLLIFLCYKEVRTAPNIMILNLAIGDMLCIISDTTSSLFYKLSSDETVKMVLCFFFKFVRPLSTGICVFSIVTLSIQRHLSVFGVTKYGCDLPKHFSSVLFICLVWVGACAMSLPQILKTKFKASRCSVQYTKTLTLVNFVVYCVASMVIVAVCSISTSRRLSQSIRHIPGEHHGQDTLRRNRARSARLLIVLSVIFTLSYAPFYLSTLIYTWNPYLLDSIVDDYIIKIAHSLTFVNSCFNPIALYASSRSFRTRFNNVILFFCRRMSKALKRELKSAQNSIEERNTVSSSF